MENPALIIPRKRVSAWVVETDPKSTHAWLQSLPLANTAAAAREIYQALYTLNRLDLKPQNRFELMELYVAPVAIIAAGLQTHLVNAPLPLSEKKRQLAEFIRQLHIEMAYGYKCCLQDLTASRVWGRKQLLAPAVERGLRYLKSVLLSSYQVYMPYPAGAWREIHELYRFAEASEVNNVAIEIAQADGATRSVTITQRYFEALLLGVCNPYQLPQNACQQVDLFLGQWAGKARLLSNAEVANPVGHFLIDMNTDSPPIAYSPKAALQAGPHLRVLNAIDLVRTVHSFIRRLQRGESSRSLELGIEFIDTSCVDLLQRMVRAWGLVARRRYPRIKRDAQVFLCTGLKALHFFSDGQRPFHVRDDEGDLNNDPHRYLHDQIADDPATGEEDEMYIALDQPIGQPADISTVVAQLPVSETFHVHKWQVRDIGPQGMSLSRVSEIGAPVRIGDLLGLQDANAIDRWSVAVARWLKSPEINSVEMGVEVLASEVTPVSIKSAAALDMPDNVYHQALLLPATSAGGRPATLLVARGTYRSDGEYLMRTANEPARQIRALKVLERSGSFEQILFADSAI